LRAHPKHHAVVKEATEEKGSNKKKKGGRKRRNNNNDGAAAKNDVTAAAAKMEEMKIEQPKSNNGDDVKQRCRHGCVESSSLANACREFMNSLYESMSMEKACDGLEHIDSYYRCDTTTWSAKDKLKWFVSKTTDHFLYGEHKDAQIYAYFASFNLEDLRMAQNSFELMNADARTVVSFLKKHVSCNCLDEKYEQLKSLKITGTCSNVKCSLPERRVERSKMMTCSGCSMVHYCSRECQKDDWKTRHKKHCNNFANILQIADDDSLDMASAEQDLKAILSKW
jgi:hypothetical protein